MVGVLRLDAREPRAESTIPVLPRSSLRKDQRILAPGPKSLVSPRLHDGAQQIRFPRDAGEVRRAQALVIIDGVLGIKAVAQSKKSDRLLTGFSIHNLLAE